MTFLFNWSHEPVPNDFLFIRVKVTEKLVRNLNFPNAPFYPLPILNPLRTFDHHFLSWSSHIGNSSIIAQSRVLWFYPFSVYPFMDNYRISGYRNRSSFINC